MNAILTSLWSFDEAFCCTGEPGNRTDIGFRKTFVYGVLNPPCTFCFRDNIKYNYCSKQCFFVFHFCFFLDFWKEKCVSFKEHDCIDDKIESSSEFEGKV